MSQLKNFEISSTGLILCFWQCPSVAQYLDIKNWLLRIYIIVCCIVNIMYRCNVELSDTLKQWNLICNLRSSFLSLSQRRDTGTFWTTTFFGGNGFIKYLQISLMMFCNHFGVKGLILGTMFLPFSWILIFSCLCDAGTFKLAFCFETYSFLSYSPNYLFYLRTT